MPVSFSLTLSNSVEYTFNVELTNLNVPQRIQFTVKVAWSEGEWVTSFNEDDISDSCHYIAKYLVGDECTVQDKAYVYTVFYTIASKVNDKILTALEEV